MKIAILNIISWSSLMSQVFIAILYTLGVIFYKFNKTITENTKEEISTLNGFDSIEYFSDVPLNDSLTRTTEFENFDDYSAFSKEKDTGINTSNSVDEIAVIEPEYVVQEAKNEGNNLNEIIEDSDEDYVLQNAIPTATVEGEDFEQIDFDLFVEQENSITMVDEDDIKRVFQSNDWMVRHQKVNH